MNINQTPLIVVAAVIQRQIDGVNKVLVVRRAPGQSGAGDWEFPGGKLERGENPEQALVREIQEELGIQIKVGSCLGIQDFTYPHRTIRLCVYWATTLETELVLVDHDAFLWCRPNEIQIETLSAADRPFVDLIIQGSK